MVHRDPETGRFLPGSGEAWDDIEVSTFAASVGVQASDLTGGTGFGGGDNNEWEGLELIDYDDIVDRNEELRLLGIAHHLAVYVNSTETADGSVAAAVEVSASPSLTTTTQRAARPTTGALSTTGAGAGNAVGGSDVDDTIDLVGRPLAATGHAPFSDGATGVGGGGSEGMDSQESTLFPAEFGRFHPRDELFLNGRISAWNIDDAGVHVTLSGQHVYGVLAED